MKNETIAGNGASSVVYENLEAFVRQRAQGFIQEVLEEEATALLGRRRWQRRRGVDATSGYRNGYGKPRKLSLSSGRLRCAGHGCGGCRSGLRAGSCRCLGAEPRRRESCCRSCIRMGWRKGTSTWHCEDCLARGRRCRRRRFRVIVAACRA